MGRLLVNEETPAGTLAEWLYERVPFVLLAHDTSEDPRFVYADLAAAVLRLHVGLVRRHAVTSVRRSA